MNSITNVKEKIARVEKEVKYYTKLKKNSEYSSGPYWYYFDQILAKHDHLNNLCEWLEDLENER